MKSQISQLVSKSVFIKFIAALTFFFAPILCYGQTTCPSMQPVITGTDTTRSRNAWQIGAPVVVNIVNTSMSGNGAYVFSSTEIQAIRDVITSWQSSLTCSNIVFSGFFVGSDVDPANRSVGSAHFVY